MNDSDVLQGLYAYADVGRTGLCNMLFPWARAILFARRRHCPVLAPGWTNYFRVGPWLRGERDKRYYLRQFTNEGYITGFRKMATLLKFMGRRVGEREACSNDIESGIVFFSGLGCYFKDLAGNEDFLREELIKIVSPKIVCSLNRLPDKFVGVHVRRGDFVSTGQELPLDYYLRGIDVACKSVGSQMPVLVFSDGDAKELNRLRDCHNVVFMPVAPALHDMLALSRASIVVGTNHSSFSEWAAFLGGKPSVWDKNGRPPSYDFMNIFV